MEEAEGLNKCVLGFGVVNIILLSIRWAKPEISWLFLLLFVCPFVLFVVVS